MKNNYIIPRDSNEILTFIEKGNNNFDQDHYESAIEFYSKAYQLNQDRQICLKLAECHFKLNQFQETLKYIYQVPLENNITNPSVLRMKALSLYHLERLEDSLDALKLARSHMPNDKNLEEKYNIVQQVLLNFNLKSLKINQLFCQMHQEQITSFNILKNIPLQQRLICRQCKGQLTLINVKKVLEQISEQEYKNFQNIKQIEQFIHQEKQRYYLNFQKQYKVLQIITNTIVECQHEVQENFQMLHQALQQFKKVSSENQYQLRSAFCLAELVSLNDDETKLRNIKQFVNFLNNQAFQKGKTRIQNILQDLDLNKQELDQSTPFSISEAKEERKLRNNDQNQLKQYAQSLQEYEKMRQRQKSLQQFAFFNLDQTKIFLVQDNHIKLLDISTSQFVSVFQENPIKKISQFTIRLDGEYVLAAEEKGNCVLWTRNQQSQYMAKIISNQWQYQGIQFDQTKNVERFYSWLDEQIIIWGKHLDWSVLRRIYTNPYTIGAFASSNMNIIAYGEKMLNIVEINESKFEKKNIEQQRSLNSPNIVRICLVNQSSQNQTSRKIFICIVFDDKNIELWKTNEIGNMMKYFLFAVDFFQCILFTDLKENKLVALSKDFIYLFEFDLNNPEINQHSVYQFPKNLDTCQEFGQIVSLPNQDAVNVFYLSLESCSLMQKSQKLQPLNKVYQINHINEKLKNSLKLLLKISTQQEYLIFKYDQLKLLRLLIITQLRFQKKGIAEYIYKQFLFDFSFSCQQQTKNLQQSIILQKFSISFLQAKSKFNFQSKYNIKSQT